MNIHNFSNTISRRSYLYEVFVISHQTSSSITLRSKFSWYRKSSVTGLQDNYINRRSLDRLAPNWVTNEERHMQADDGFGHDGTWRSTWHRHYGGETCDLERTTGFQRSGSLWTFSCRPSRATVGIVKRYHAWRMDDDWSYSRQSRTSRSGTRRIRGGLEFCRWGGSSCHLRASQSLPTARGSVSIPQSVSPVLDH